MTCEVCGTRLKQPYTIRPTRDRAPYCPTCTGRRALQAQQQAREKHRVERAIERRKK